MARSFSGDPGAYLPTTSIFDTSNVRNIDVNSNEFKNFLVDLLQTVNNIALVVNVKESGYFYLTQDNQPFTTGAVYFPASGSNVGRNVSRKVINFGALPNSGTTSVAHGITFDSQLIATRIYGAATNPGNGFVPVPNVEIKVTVDTTNINIITTANYSAYTVCYMIIEYLTS